MCCGPVGVLSFFFFVDVLVYLNGCSTSFVLFGFTCYAEKTKSKLEKGISD